jgi:hypothetical protein
MNGNNKSAAGNAGEHPSDGHIDDNDAPDFSGSRPSPDENRNDLNPVAVSKDTRKPTDPHPSDGYIDDDEVSDPDRGVAIH